MKQVHLLFLAAVVLLPALIATPAAAQETQEAESADTAKARDGAKRDEPREGSLRDLIRDRVRRSAGLPEAAEEAREAGIPEKEVEGVIVEARRRRLPPEEIEEVLVEGAASARENGPVDNFGAFVQSQLDQGLRGRELADAIHAEHARRGKGKLKHGDDPRSKGKGKGKGHGKDKGKDKPGKNK